MKSRIRKSLVSTLLITGLVLGIALSYPIGSIFMGIATGLCLSFFMGHVFCRSLEKFST